MSESDVPQEIKQGVKDIGEGILSMSKSLEKLTTGVNGLCKDMGVLCKDMGWSIKIVLRCSFCLPHGKDYSRCLVRFFFSFLSARYARRIFLTAMSQESFRLLSLLGLKQETAVKLAARQAVSRAWAT